MPLGLVLGVRGTSAGHRLGIGWAPWRGGWGWVPPTTRRNVTQGGTPPPFQCIPLGGGEVGLGALQFLGGGFAEMGSFGRAFVKVLCLLSVCLQHVTQGLAMLQIGFCLDRCHPQFVSTANVSRFFGLKWLRKALYGQSQRAPPPVGRGVCVCEKGLFLAA